MQTKKVTSFPVVLLGHAYWDGLVDWLRSTVLAGGKINAARPRPVPRSPTTRTRRCGSSRPRTAAGAADRGDAAAGRRGGPQGRRVVAAVCVYCSSSGRIDPAYVELAAAVGTELARRGHALVSGGGSVSCMGAVARAARAGGARTVGVIPRVLLDLEVADHDADELLVTDDMRARKGLMDARVRRVPHPARRARHPRGAARDLGVPHPRHARQAGRRARPGRRLRPAARPGRPARRPGLRPRTAPATPSTWVRDVAEAFDAARGTQLAAAPAPDR